jgi:hypothetical protein
MAGLLNTSSCAPANLEAGDSEEIAQVDALLLMSHLRCVGQLGAPVQCWLYQTAHKLGLFHHPVLKLFHGLCIMFYISVCIFDSWQILFVISSKQGSKA